MKITNFYENGALRCPQKSLNIACNTSLRRPGRALGSKKPGKQQNLLEITKYRWKSHFLHKNHQIFMKSPHFQGNVEVFMKSPIFMKMAPSDVHRNHWLLHVILIWGGLGVPRGRGNQEIITVYWKSPKSVKITHFAPESPGFHEITPFSR